MIGSSYLTISLEPFKVLPADFLAGKYKLEAFILNDSPLPVKIDFSCNCLTKVNNTDWISFDESLQSIFVETQNFMNVGKHTIIVVQSFDDFIDVHPFTAFTVNITFIGKETKKYTVDKAPYFEPPL